MENNINKRVAKNKIICNNSDMLHHKIKEADNMKEGIIDSTILEKTVRRENGKTLKRVQGDMSGVQGDMEVYGHCERMRSNPANYLARSADKDFSPLTSHLSRKYAFTLAEVLITLGIIGVVAAMTMPALIQHYKKQEASAKLKKFYSMMSQAILMSEAHNGPISDWNHPERLADKNNTIIENPEDRREFFNKYLKPYLKTVKSESTDEKDDTVILSDGSMIHLESGYCTGLLYDINGDKKPNVHGRDRFSFVICPDSYKKTYIDANHNFGVYYQSYASTKSRDELVNECKKEGNSNSCTVLLMYDNWEFKDDYPRKL